MKKVTKENNNLETKEKNIHPSDIVDTEFY